MSEPRRLPVYARPLVLCAALLVAVLVFFWRDLGSWDVWLHLTSGRVIVRDHVIHNTDHYSFRALGRPWNNHQWLSCIMLHGVWTLAGAWGVMVARAVLLGVALIASWALARRRKVDAGLAALLALGAASQLRVRALARPYLISFVMFMVVVWILYDCILREAAAEDVAPDAERPFAAEDAYLWGRGGRLILLLPAMWLWANLHAGYMMGLLLLGTFGVGELVGVWANRGDASLWEAVWRLPVGARFRAMLTAGIACMALAVVTPYGAETVLYPFRLTLTVDLLSRIAEWQPVKLSRTYALYWCVLGLGSLIMLRALIVRAARGELREHPGVYATDLLLFAGFCFLPLRGVRHIAWVLLLMPAILGRHLLLREGNTAMTRARTRLLAVLALAVAVLVVPLGAVSRGFPDDPLKEDTYPVQAAEFIEEAGLADVRFYNTYEWGGYLIWRWWPERKVFIDGRCLVYRDDLLRETFDVSDDKEGWRDILRRWGVEMIIFRYSNYNAEHFFERGQWPCIYWDDAALVLLHRERWMETDLPNLELSNPVTFDWANGPADPEATLQELEYVLKHVSDCHTALAEQSRCLVALAEEGNREVRLKRADALARRAVRMSGGDVIPWLAVYHVARARGEDDRAETARQRALVPRKDWLERKGVLERLGLAEDDEDGDSTPEAQDVPGANAP